MSKDEKYLYLIRKLHWAERNFMQNVPWEHLAFKWDENVAWEQLENIDKNEGLTHLQQIALKRAKKIRMDIYLEINELLGNEEFLKFMDEYMAMDKDTCEPINPIGNFNSAGQVLGGLWKHQTIDYIPNDDMPVTYKVLNHLPIDEKSNKGKGTKNEKYRVEINSVETTISYDCYSVLEHIRNKHKETKFHFKHMLFDLEENKQINKDYDGKPHLLFRQRPEILEILFEPLKSPRGYWICKIEHWFE